MARDDCDDALMPPSIARIVFLAGSWSHLHGPGSRSRLTRSMDPIRGVHWRIANALGVARRRRADGLARQYLDAVRLTRYS